jgi:hypothetical protein
MDRLGLTFHYSQMVWVHKDTQSVFTLDYLNSSDDVKLQTDLFKVTGFILDKSEIDIMRNPPVQYSKLMKEST